MKNYRFYNFDGNSINVFGISDAVFADDPVDIFGLSDHTRDLGYTGKVIGLLQSEQITGIEYDFIINAIQHLEIDKQGHTIIDKLKPFDSWWEENITPIYKKTMLNAFVAIQDTAKDAFIAGREYERKSLTRNQ